jgi:hypothetical protein
LASALIWLILVASKRHQNKAKNVNRERLDSTLFHERNTKPSRFRS